MLRNVSNSNLLNSHLPECWLHVRGGIGRICLPVFVPVFSVATNKSSA